MAKKCEQSLGNDMGYLGHPEKFSGFLYAADNRYGSGGGFRREGFVIDFELLQEIFERCVQRGRSPISIPCPPPQESMYNAPIVHQGTTIWCRDAPPFVT